MDYYAQMVVIYELLGWTQCLPEDPNEKHSSDLRFTPSGFPPGAVCGDPRELLPGLDSDVMIQVWNGLPPYWQGQSMVELEKIVKKRIGARWETVHEVIHLGWLVNATCEDRVEAILRSLNKWAESKPKRRKST